MSASSCRLIQQVVVAGLSSLVMLYAAPAAADSIKRTVLPDGTIEFTNVEDSNSGRASTRDEVVFRYQDEDGVVVYSGAQPNGAEFDVIRFHCYACDPDSTVDWRTTPLFTSRYNEEIDTTSASVGVDPALVRAVIHAESAFNPRALSPKGAQGLMQLMPATARELGVSNAMAADENIRGGVSYLARMLERFNGDTTLATAAYNAGPTAVSRHGGVPPYAETRAYVERVRILRERYAAR